MAAPVVLKVLKPGAENYYDLEAVRIRVRPDRHVLVDDYRRRLRELQLTYDHPPTGEDQSLFVGFPSIAALNPSVFQQAVLKSGEHAFIAGYVEVIRGGALIAWTDDEWRPRISFRGRQYTLVFKRSLLDLAEGARTTLFAILETTQDTTYTVSFDVTFDSKLVGALTYVDREPLVIRPKNVENVRVCSVDADKVEYMDGRMLEMEAVFWLLSRERRLLMASPTLWGGVHCLVDFPDLHIERATPGDTESVQAVELRIKQPRALFTIYPRDDANDIYAQEFNVDLRVNGQYRHLTCSFDTLEQKERTVYFTLLNVGKNWLVAAWFTVAHVESSSSAMHTPHRMEKIEILYENIDATKLLADAFVLETGDAPLPRVSLAIAKAPQSVTNALPVLYSPSLVTLGTNVQPVAMASHMNMSSSSSSSSSLSSTPFSSDFFTAFTTLPNDAFFNESQYGDFGAAVSDDESGSDEDGYPRSFIGAIMERMKRKRHHHITAHEVHEPRHATGTLVNRLPHPVTHVVMDIGNMHVKFVGNDDALPLYLDFEKFYPLEVATLERGHRYIVHAKFIVDGKRHHRTFNLKLKRRKQRVTDEYYSVMDKEHEIVMHFQNDELHACFFRGVHGQRSVDVAK